VSAWVATTDPGNDRCRFEISFRDGNDDPIGIHQTELSSEIESQSRSPGTTWLQIAETYRVSPGTRKIRFLLIGENTSGSMIAAFDDAAMANSQAVDRVEGNFPLVPNVRYPNFDQPIFGVTKKRPLSWMDLSTGSARFRCRSDFNTPISGSFVATGVGSSVAEGEQILDLFAEQLESWVTAGRLTLRLKSYVSTIGDDFGRLGMKFYDEDMNLLSTVLDEQFNTAADMVDNVWSEAVFFVAVLVNARFIGQPVRLPHPCRRVVHHRVHGPQQFRLSRAGDQGVACTRQRRPTVQLPPPACRRVVRPAQP
jgi:hypothetical protein